MMRLLQLMLNVGALQVRRRLTARPVMGAQLVAA